MRTNCPRRRRRGSAASIAGTDLSSPTGGAVTASEEAAPAVVTGSGVVTADFLADFFPGLALMNEGSVEFPRAGASARSAGGGPLSGRSDG